MLRRALGVALLCLAVRTACQQQMQMLSGQAIDTTRPNVNMMAMARDADCFTQCLASPNCFAATFWQSSKQCAHDPCAYVVLSPTDNAFTVLKCVPPLSLRIDF